MKNKLKISHYNKWRYGVVKGWFWRAPALYYRRFLGLTSQIMGLLYQFRCSPMLSDLRRFQGDFLRKTLFRYVVLLRGFVIVRRLFARYTPLRRRKATALRLRMFLKRKQRCRMRLFYRFRHLQLRLLFLARIKQFRRRFWRGQLRYRFFRFLVRCCRLVSNSNLVPLDFLRGLLTQYFGVLGVKVEISMPLQRTFCRQKLQLRHPGAVKASVKGRPQRLVMRLSKFQVLRQLYLRLLVERDAVPRLGGFLCHFQVANNFIRARRALWWVIVNRNLRLLPWLHNVEQRRVNLFFSTVFNLFSGGALAQKLAVLFSQGRRHARILRILSSNLEMALAMLCRVSALRLVFCGKFAGRRKTAMRAFTFGDAKITTQQVTRCMSYGSAVSETYAGVFGVHVWIART